MNDRWIIDKSAYERLHRSPDAEQWLSRLNRGLIYVSAITLLELGFSARNAGDWETSLHRPPVANLLIEYFTPAIEERAIQVQGLLAERGQHRAPSIPDLLIAATAEVMDLCVLHLDKDFELIADLTGQRVERLLVANLPLEGDNPV